MTKKPKILAFAGSLRKDSYNKKLIRNAAKYAEDAGAEVTLIELNDFSLPLYNEEIEKEGLPENALKLKKLLQESDGFMISTPEYNSSLPAVLKNAIDWVSRKASPEEKDLSCFVDKLALLFSTSPGNLGGLRSLTHLRAILENISTMVLPQQKAIPQAAGAFDAEGNLTDASQQRSIQSLTKKFVETLTKLKG